MYNTRLKQWNICKNYRAEEKEQLAARIAQAHLEKHSISDLTFKSRPVKLDRVLRHLRTKKRNISSKSIAKGQILRTHTEDSVASDSSTSDPSEESMVRLPRTTKNTCTTTPPGSGHTSSSLLTPTSPDSNEEDECCDIVRHDHPCPEVPDPSPVIFSPKDSLKPEIILHHLQTYYSHLMDDLVKRPVLPDECTEPPTVVWSDVKTGIYLLKKQSPKLAWPLLNKASVLAGEIFSDTHFLLLNHVLTVLSPVNTRVYPQVRTTMLKYLAEMAAIKLKSRRHPLVLILQELVWDNDLGEASEVALRFILSLFTQSLGPGNPATFAVHRSLVSLLRRDKRLDAAKREGENLVNAMKQALVVRSNTDIYQRPPASTCMTNLCVALTELIHVLIDMGDYVPARSLCSSVIQNYKTIQGVNYPDSRAAYVMEDVAELCNRLHDHDEASYWLQQALDASSMIRGETNATTQHIRDKLQRMTFEAPFQKIQDIDGLVGGSQAAECRLFADAACRCPSF